jgi:penicillin-binding protein 1A
MRNTYRLNSRRTIRKKIAEFYLARVINKHKSKEAILTQYLNTIAFGYLNYGFESASRYFFGKPLVQLTKAELLALLVIPRNPALYDPYKQQNAFTQRYTLLLDYLLENKVIDQEEYTQIKNEKLIFTTTHENKLPYIIDLMNKQINHSQATNLFLSGYVSPLTRGGAQRAEGFVDQSLSTTLDYNLSQEIYEMARETIMKLMRKNVGDF